jgi:plasmid stabilization system protein ParE
MVVVAFHRLAAKDFREARGWYAVRDSDVAARFADAVDDAVARIREAPDTHPQSTSAL